MPRFVAALAVACTLLLAVIAVELYPIARVAWMMGDFATGVARGIEKADGQTNAERREQIKREAAQAVDDFNAALEGAQQSVRSRRSSRPPQAAASPTAK